MAASGHYVFISRPVTNGEPPPVFLLIFGETSDHIPVGSAIMQGAHAPSHDRVTCPAAR
jgi:hypothetical protein